MPGAFEAATEAALADIESKSPEANTQEAAPSLDASQNQEEKDQAQKLEAILELDKAAKFKFKGKEWTPQELEKHILRQEDYTKKTQALASERKAIDEDRKFYDNLYYDLRAVQSNPKLVGEFVKLYPEKFHSYLKDVLANNQTPTEAVQTAQVQSIQAKPAVDVETAARLAKLEKFYNDQEVSKVKSEIENKVQTMAKKYPQALQKYVLADAYELYSKQGQPLTDDQWEDLFKTNEAEIKNLVKAQYGDLVKKQTQANAKARDVESGGGTPTNAPPKFKSIKDITEFAVKQSIAQQ